MAEGGVPGPAECLGDFDVRALRNIRTAAGNSGVSACFAAVLGLLGHEAPTLATVQRETADAKRFLRRLQAVDAGGASKAALRRAAAFADDADACAACAAAGPTAASLARWVQAVAAQQSCARCKSPSPRCAHDPRPDAIPRIFHAATVQTQSVGEMAMAMLAGETIAPPEVRVRGDAVETPRTPRGDRCASSHTEVDVPGGDRYRFDFATTVSAAGEGALALRPLFDALAQRTAEGGASLVAVAGGAALGCLCPSRPKPAPAATDADTVPGVRSPSAPTDPSVFSPTPGNEPSQAPGGGLLRAILSPLCEAAGAVRVAVLEVRGEHIHDLLNPQAAADVSFHHPGPRAARVSNAGPAARADCAEELCDGAAEAESVWRRCMHRRQRAAAALGHVVLRASVASGAGASAGELFVACIAVGASAGSAGAGHLRAWLETLAREPAARRSMTPRGASLERAASPTASARSSARSRGVVGTLREHALTHVLANALMPGGDGLRAAVLATVREGGVGLAHSGTALRWCCTRSPVTNAARLLGVPATRLFSPAERAAAAAAEVAATTATATAHASGSPVGSVSRLVGGRSASPTAEDVRLSVAVEEVGRVRKAELSAFRAAEPPPAVCRAAEAALLCLGCLPSECAEWEAVRRALCDPSLLRKMRAGTVAPRVSEAAWRRLNVILGSDAGAAALSGYPVAAALREFAAAAVAAGAVAEVKQRRRPTTAPPQEQQQQQQQPVPPYDGPCADEVRERLHRRDLRDRGGRTPSPSRARAHSPRTVTPAMTPGTVTPSAMDRSMSPLRASRRVPPPPPTLQADPYPTSPRRAAWSWLCSSVPKGMPARDLERVSLGTLRRLVFLSGADPATAAACEGYWHARRSGTGPEHGVCVGPAGAAAAKEQRHQHLRRGLTVV
eukprot:TRINITY_DN3754_c1_g2_i1.p1 TRINITY_DN3754_c1_g2~~TRINITY_DN3754_c1_g2_i1.p1  ORF type:complete len:925 (+),score=277.31 TRINITY_DN3754_c1_g2_i1:57-2777(+)